MRKHVMFNAETAPYTIDMTAQESSMYKQQYHAVRHDLHSGAPKTLHRASKTPLASVEQTDGPASNLTLIRFAKYFTSITC